MYFTGSNLDIISPRRESGVAAPRRAKKKKHTMPGYYLDSESTMRRRLSKDEFLRSSRTQSGRKMSRRQREYELFIKKMIFGLVAAGTLSVGAATSAAVALLGHDCNDDIQTVNMEDFAVPFEEEKGATVGAEGIYAQNNFREEINQIIQDTAANYNDIEVSLEEEPEELVAAPAAMPDDVSNEVIELLKGWETYRGEAYLCPSGKLTIGWGHTKDVYEGQTTTMEEAEEFLRQDIQEAMDTVTNYAKSLDVVLTQGQFDALVSFAYNCGIGKYQSSGLTELIADGDIDGAADKMREYIKGKIEIKDENNNGTGEYVYVVMPGLVGRRETESSWLYR